MKQAFITFNKEIKWKAILFFLFITFFGGLGLYRLFVRDNVIYHTIVELITILISILIILIILTMRRFIKNYPLILIICISVFFTGIIDLFHVFSYPGMNFFSNQYEPTNLTLSFWILARSFQVLSILLAVFITKYSKSINYYYIIFGYILVTFVGIVIIMQGYFPQTYIIGEGLTLFKISSEYVIMLLFIVSGVLIVKFKMISDNNMLLLFIAFIVFQVVSEFFFTQYIETSDDAFFVGHHFKIMASLIISFILIKSSIVSPNEKLYLEIVHQKDQLGKLLKYEKLTREITEICSAAINKTNFVDEVLELLGSTLEVDHTFIYKHIEDRGVFKLINGWFNPDSKFTEVGDGYEFFVVDNLLEKFKNRITHYSADTSKIENKYARENFLDIGLFAYINEPLFVNDKFYGFTGYNMTTTNRETIEDDITLIKSVAKILTQTIERIEAFKEIEYLNNHDDLTGSFNRRYFEEYIKQVDKEQFYPLGIVVIDLNGLKLINDAFGHLAGDKMLIKTVDLLESTLDDSGTLFRIGGDEFVVLIERTTSDDVYNLFDIVQEKCKDVFVSSVQLSLSYGVHIRTSNSSPFYEEFKIAEDEMYRMKLMDVPSMRTNAIETILNTLFEKDEYSNDHCNSVSQMTEVLAQKMGFNNNHVSQIKMAGLLHDIGKIIVPDHILKKEGKLDHLEYLEIKKHTEIGYRILSSTKDFREIAEFVLSHHEWYDGTGYPHGKKGEDIPIESRIIAVIDAFDAMVSYRSYRDSITKEQAVEELKKYSGTQFDPKIVKIFIENINEIIEHNDNLKSPS